VNSATSCPSTFRHAERLPGRRRRGTFVPARAEMTQSTFVEAQSKCVRVIIDRGVARGRGGGILRAIPLRCNYIRRSVPIHRRSARRALVRKITSGKGGTTAVSTPSSNARLRSQGGEDSARAINSRIIAGASNAKAYPTEGRRQSGLAPENLTTLAHFSVSLGYQLAEFGRAHRHSLAAEAGETRLQFRVRQRRGHRTIELVDDIGGVPLGAAIPYQIFAS